ncbi:MAG: DMT family transporter [Opitutales bacterium]
MTAGKGIFPALMALSFMWGSAHIFLKVSSTDIPPILLAALRAGIALPIMGIVCAYRREITLNKKVVRDMLAIGTLNGWLPNCLAALAITSISSAEAGILRATTPIITGVGAALLLRDEKLTLTTIISLVTGSLGVFFVVSSAFELNTLGSLKGYLLMIGVSASFGLGMVYARWAQPSQPAFIASGQLLFATVMALAISWGLGEDWSLDWSIQSFLAVLLLGIFSTALPAIFFLTIISKYEAVKVGTTALLQPIWAVLLGCLFLNETVLLAQLFGTFVIILSVLSVTNDLNSLRILKALLLRNRAQNKQPD